MLFGTTLTFLTNMSMTESTPSWLATSEQIAKSKQNLDQHAYESVQWHFHDSTGSPFWLAKKAELKFDPLKEVKVFDDLKKFPEFEDEWLRGGPINRWIPKGLLGKPTYVFETGGTTGIPKSRMVIDDFRIDYENFSDTLSSVRITQFRRKDLAFGLCLVQTPGI